MLNTVIDSIVIAIELIIKKRKDKKACLYDPNSFLRLSLAVRQILHSRMFRYMRREFILFGHTFLFSKFDLSKNIIKLIKKCHFCLSSLCIAHRDVHWYDSFYKICKKRIINLFVGNSFLDPKEEKIFNR